MTRAAGLVQDFPLFIGDDMEETVERLADDIRVEVVGLGLEEWDRFCVISATGTGWERRLEPAIVQV